jgi:hypothetical protein
MNRLEAASITADPHPHVLQNLFKDALNIVRH